MPRSSSIENDPQLLAPPTYLYASLGHVSYPNSPGGGIVWNCQTLLPVITSYARMSPGGETNASPGVDPTISRFFQTFPGLLLFQPMLLPRRRSARRSTVPSMPN